MPFLTHAVQFVILCSLTGILVLGTTVKERFFPTHHARRQKGDHHE
jgi:hypothetical protein